MRVTILLLFLLLPAIGFAQISPSDVEVDSSKTVEVELQNGSILTGSILSLSEEEIELQQSDGRTFIHLSRVREIRDVDLTKKGNQWFKNPNYSRLFFSPTAQPLQKNSGYYQNIYVFFNNVAYAVSDNIAFTGGFSMIPSVSISNQLYFFTGKVGFEVADGHYLGGGLGAASANTFEDALIIGYANYTHGFHRGNITGGVTTFSIENEIGTYALYFGGDYRFIQRISFVTENFIFPEAGDELVLSYGLRFMGEKMSFDLAFFRPGLGTDIGFGIPYVDFVFNF
ncbi:MAG: hypothetical protein RI575_06135 [Balneolaceae bacterium]|nr:hypothetical protein [Balneolaceae bacterium]MDR9407933.1 hypothetical protein [Balneolaceae bacterium]